MRVINTKFEGLLLFEIGSFIDERGFFFESWRYDFYKKAGITKDFVQDNSSFSKKNVLRGLHFRKSLPEGQLVWVSHGTIFDVAVDIRPHSQTFMKYFGIELNAITPRQVYMPPGFAHGFCVLSDEGAIVNYKCTEYYNSADAFGIVWNDPLLAIDWPIASPIISNKDANLPTLNNSLLTV